MDECRNCMFPLLPGELPCPECGFGSKDWAPEDLEDDTRPYRATDDGMIEVFCGP